MLKRKKTILDSSLILTTETKSYDVKLVECGDYCQLYVFANKKIKKKKDTSDLELKKHIVNSMFDNSSQNKHSTLSLISNIDEKNIIRSKLECQRLAKANIDEWKTFITLTFADNVNDLKAANKKFRYFIDKIQRVKNDFKYLCIPEFQKRGAVHYHLLSNIDKTDKLIFEQEDDNKYLHIKYWNEGFTSVEPMTGDVKKIIGYISKYMTKDIDNRLFNKHRYFFSRNLKRPKENYIDFSKENEKKFYKKIIQEKELIYQSEYTNIYDKEQVIFLEYLKK